LSTLDAGQEGGHGTALDGAEHYTEVKPTRVTNHAPAMKESVLQSRIKDLERQLDHQKEYYLSKLRSKDPLVPTNFGGRLKKSKVGPASGKNKDTVDTTAGAVSGSGSGDIKLGLTEADRADNRIYEIMKEKQGAIEDLTERNRALQLKLQDATAEAQRMKGIPPTATGYAINTSSSSSSTGPRDVWSEVSGMSS
jgi:hypothetical protein